MAKKIKSRRGGKTDKRQAPKLVPQDQQKLDWALRALQQGHSSQARDVLLDIYHRTPEHPLTNYLLGVLAGGREQSADAERHLRTAVQGSPDNPGFNFALGDFLAREERFDEAAASFRRVLRLDAGSVDAYAALGLVLYKAGKYREARQPFDEAIRRAPEITRHYMNAAANAIALNDAAQALAVLDQAGPSRGQACAADLADLGRIFAQLRRPNSALSAYDAALLQSPDDPDILASKARALAATHEVDACVATYERAAQLRGKPEDADEWIAGALGEAGLVIDALRYFAKAEAKSPGGFSVRSDQLLLKNYLADISEDALFEAHKGAADCLDPEPYPDPPADLCPRRAIRIGYVSADFRRHSVSYFIEPVLTHHDPRQFEIFCYYNGKDHDVVTRRIRQSCTAWREIHSLSDDEAAALIRADGIDILVDLSGHTSGHRLPVFARRPAPIQVSWLGYPNTTGLRQIDFRISDAVADPVGETEKWHTETLVRLPTVFSCYQPPRSAPAVARPPFVQNGYVTFGSFNNVNKLNERVLASWAEVLRRVPDSRLLLKDSALQNEAMRERILAFYGREGVSADRLTLLGRDSNIDAHLARYAEMDIALDPYPYCGTTTTCEALWMGVPVVTLAGKSHRARVGASQLTALGLPELIADSSNRYVDIAEGLARAGERLAALREELRTRFATSPLMDHSGFTRELEGVFRDLWEQHRNPDGPSADVSSADGSG